MSSNNWISPSDKAMYPDNPMDRLDNLEREAFIEATDDIKAGSSAELADSTGAQRIDEQVAMSAGVTVTEPTDTGFTGVFRSGRGKTFDNIPSMTFNDGTAKNGRLQVGSNTNGVWVAGAGNVTADEDGIKFSSGADLIVNQWIALGLPNDSLTTEVYAVAYDSTNNVAYIGGSFTKIGGIDAKYIAKYNLTTREWGNCGSPTALTSVVLAIAISGDRVFVGGGFINANGIATADRIALYTISTGIWSSIGGQLNNLVIAIAISGDRVFVGGDFTNADGIATADYIALYTISTGIWSSIGGQLSARVEAIAISGDRVFVGGDFTNADGIATADYIALYTISTGIWSSIGGQLNGAVLAIAISGDMVFMGGAFTNADGIATADYIALYTISTGIWSSIGGQLNGAVEAMVISDDVVFVGGQFTNADGIATADYIALYTISTGLWSSTAQFDSRVFCLCVAGLNIIAGGFFDTINGVKTRMIAMLLTGLDDVLETYNAQIVNLQDGKQGKYKNIVYVAKSGADYSSIQDALDSITDASNTNIYLIVGAPGNYAGDVAWKPFVFLRGFARSPLRISGTFTYTDASTQGTVAGIEDVIINNTAFTINFSQLYTKQFRCFNVNFGSSTINITGTNPVFDANAHIFTFSNCETFGANTYDNIIVASYYTTHAYQTLIKNAGYMQHYGGEWNGTITLQDTANLQIRHMPIVNPDPFGTLLLTITLNGTVGTHPLLMMDNSSMALCKIVNNTGTDFATQYIDSVSAGVVSPAPTITDNGNGSITIGNFGCFLFDNANKFGALRRFNITGNTFTLTNNSSNYILVSYNSGSPLLSVSTTNTENSSSVILVSQYYREGTELHGLSQDALGEGMPNKIAQALTLEQRIRVAENAKPILGEVATRVVTISSATIIYGGAIVQNINAFNSSTGEWNFWYRVAGVWTKSTSTTQYNNTQYDNGTNLVSLTGNQWTINWIYRGIETSAHAYYVLGSNNYATLAAAQLASPPTSLPPIITNHAFLVGRIIVQNGASTGTVESAFTIKFTATGIVNHNDTANIQLAGTGVTYGHISDTFASFTPKVIGSTTAGTGTYTTQTGNTSKFGNIRFFQVDLAWTAHDGTGNLLITDLPETILSGSINAPVSVWWSNLTLPSASSKVMAILINNTKTIGLRSVTDGAEAALAIDSSGSVRLSGWYFV